MTRPSLRGAILTLLSSLVVACAAVSTPPPGAIALRTQPIETPEACPAALISGTLVRHPESGIGIRDSAGRVLQVIWPRGYYARDDGGALAVIDQSGDVVAHEGDFVGIGGGELIEGTWLGCGGIQLPG
jgi:hypothetical protein